jgi:outer membrane scaffolding protein for murein synthesis (MipA/OmpV family)
MRTLTRLVACAAVPLLSVDAMATEDDTGISADVENAFVGDYLVVGAGAIALPDHEGSDDYQIAPAMAFRGRVSGVGIFSRGIGIGADIVPEIKGSHVQFSFGPVIRYRSNRTGKVEDRIVRLLPRLDKTWEAGVTGGISYRGLITKKDSLSFGSDVRWTVSGNKGGRIITPGVSYFTPVSRAAGVGLSFGADHVNGDYADYNYSIDAAGSAASGLPVYKAKGGWKDWGGRIYAGYDLDGDLRNGGWAVGAMVSYERMLGSAAKTPITSIRGSRSQWMGGLGVGYTF